MARFVTAFALLLVLGQTPSYAALTSVYTSTDPKECHVIPDERVALWECLGPKGYGARFFDDGNVVGVVYGFAGATSSFPLQWRGAKDPIGPRVEWRLDKGEPVAAILRIRILTERGTEQYLVITRVGREGGCEIGRVSAAVARANEVARRMADAYGRTKC